MSNLTFLIAINKERDWDDHLFGFRCSALNIPTAEVDSIHVGRKVDSGDYDVLKDIALIKWRDRSSVPQSATVKIVIKKELSTKEETEQAKLEVKKAEQDVAEAKQQALKNEQQALRNQKLAIVL